MRVTTVLAVLLLLGGLATAQPGGTQIPIPPFGSTFTSASLTRGFYFQCPMDFTVVGLRVPDESNFGKQNVNLYKHSSPPPAWSQTVSLRPEFSRFGEVASTIIPCNVNYKKGEWLIVIGACGDGSTMRNSYAQPRGCQPSTLLGQPITICRCGTQVNIVTSPPPHAIWNENANQLSRVEVYVATAQLTASGSAQPGTNINFSLSAPADAGLPYLMGTSLGNGPINIDTRKLELSVDDLLVLSTSNLLPILFQQYVGFLDAQGNAKARLAIPNNPQLKGIRLFNSFLTLDANAPSGVSSISDSFFFTIQ